MALMGVMILKVTAYARIHRTLYALGLLICSEAYLIAWAVHDTEIARGLRIAMWLMVVAQPVFFWLFALTLFDDRFRLRWWHAAAIAGKFILAGALVYGRRITDVFSAFSAEDFPRVIPNFFYTLAFVFHAIVVILRTDRADLIEPRRRLRRIVLVGTGLLIVHAILSAAVLRPLGFGAESDQVGLTVITLALLISLAWGEKLWSEIFSEPAKPLPETSSADPEIMAKAVQAMEADELFRSEGLTVTALAAKLGVQEYKLRRAINGGLGYRNFNEYLNFYRMRAAKKFLSAKENADYPLIHLALDLGYPSPAPFNRAFKDATGVTPGEFRKRSTSTPG